MFHFLDVFVGLLREVEHRRDLAVAEPERRCLERVAGVRVHTRIVRCKSHVQLDTDIFICLMVFHGKCGLE